MPQPNVRRYLKQNAGHCTVEIEKRDDESGRFGLGNCHKMQYCEFLDQLDAGSTSLYMTTQPLPQDKDGPTAMASQPLTEVIGDIADALSPCPPLIPDQWNMWQGASKEDSTSGLHHDTHDNIYVLLRGQKTFTLFSPADALRMHTTCDITHVHPNGMINYSVPTRADGAHPGSAAEWAAQEAQAALEAAEEQLADAKSKGLDADAIAVAQQRVDAAESRVERCMDALLDLAGAGDDGWGDEGGDDFDDEDSNTGEGAEEEDFDGDEEGGFFGADGTFLAQDAGVAVQAVRDGAQLGSNDPLMVADDFDDNTEGAVAAKTAAADASKGNTPQNFSAVDLRQAEDVIERKFPGFTALPRSKAVITPGRMLYLPAGWFHEVRSQGVAHGGHLAFNFWFHPPASHDFDGPYLDGYWQHKFHSRKPATQPGGGKRRRKA